MSNDSQLRTSPVPPCHRLAGSFEGIRHSHFGIRNWFTRAEEEEKCGKIRWLRPDFQAKGKEPGAESKKAEQQERAVSDFFPIHFIQNLTFVIRNFPNALSRPASATAIAKLFKGARKDLIEAILESLQTLGTRTKLTTNATRHERMRH